ncbi:hypothetical protein ABZZ74_23715 [Streptomyces sp. NPDC006476]|uniref:hypothetical protein n=1 Tax=Streptomyces sp. NPDC006476 TaxID=3157175 RepID=UPI0033BC055E
MPSSQIIDGRKMTLIELAEISYEEYSDSAEELADALCEQERQEFLKFAREAAVSTLGSTAAGLEWTYTPHADLPSDMQEAAAPLAPGRSEYLRYRIDHAGESIKFELVQPCSTCGQDRINEVAGIVELGRLLATGGAS